jgi:hypothetical protein
MWYEIPCSKICITEGLSEEAECSHRHNKPQVVGEDEIWVCGLKRGWKGLNWLIPPPTMVLALGPSTIFRLSLMAAMTGVVVQEIDWAAEQLTEDDVC